MQGSCHAKILAGVGQLTWCQGVDGGQLPPSEPRLGRSAGCQFLRKFSNGADLRGVPHPPREPAATGGAIFRPGPVGEVAAGTVPADTGRAVRLAGGGHFASGGTGGTGLPHGFGVTLQVSHEALWAPWKKWSSSGAVNRF